MKQLLLDRDAAAMLGVSRATVWVWTKNGSIPAPVKIGGSTRWRTVDIQAVIDGTWKTDENEAA